jgi:sorting nexin-8
LKRWTYCLKKIVRFGLESKRPLILTCNSLDTVPLDELQLHATLFFDQQPVFQAVEYLSHVAATEGHLISRADVESLFLGRGCDLRASLMDLNFWCQMTVGSQFGGLDWMRKGDSVDSKDERIVSRGTYHLGLDQLPERRLSQEDILRFAQDNCGMSSLDWEYRQYSWDMEADQDCSINGDLRDICLLAETKSCMDIVNDSTSAMLSAMATSTFPKMRRTIDHTNLIEAMLATRTTQQLSVRELADAFEPIMEDRRTFPPTAGRAAASLDGASKEIATDLAPYIRSIVAFDRRLEVQRDEMSGGGFQSTQQRKTRAARAALEGGDKSKTRRDRWFPSGLDFDAVLKTCPRGWYEGEGTGSGDTIVTHSEHEQDTVSEAMVPSPSADSDR